MKIEIHIHHHYAEEAAILDGLKELKELVNMSQEDFDSQVAAVNSKLDEIGTTVKANADVAAKTQVDVASVGKEVADFIAAHPDVDTSSLQGVVDRLGGVESSLKDQGASLSSIDTGVEGIFPTAPAATATDHADGGAPIEQAPPQADPTPEAPAPEGTPAGETGSQPTGDASGSPAAPADGGSPSGEGA